MIETSFFCIGAQKAGTTTLHDLLAQVPKICLPYSKETKFFIEDSRYNKGLSYYDAFFTSQNCTKASVRGEIDPDYIYFDQALQRIKISFGTSIKLIVILRNPVDRAYSHYLMSMKRGIENTSFKEAIEIEQTRLEQFGDKARHHFSYLDRGYYGRQLGRVVSYFPIENILIIPFEKFTKSLQYYLKQVLRFIGLQDEDEIIKSINFHMESNVAKEPRIKIINKIMYSKTIINSAARILIPSEQIRIKTKRFIHREIDKYNDVAIKNKTLDPSIRIKILQRYKQDIEQLSKISKIDFSYWLEEL